MLKQLNCKYQSLMVLLQQFESEVASQAINTLQVAVETGNEAEKYEKTPSSRYTIALYSF